MNINGLQKLTLLDFPGHTACTVFFAGCNFRCPFCHNSELLDGTADPVMTDKEFFAFLKKREGLLDGVAITGGEPLMSSGIEEFIEGIRKAGFSVKLDTNGFFPEKLEGILKNGLADYVAMDIKNSPELYARTCGLKDMDLGPVRKSVELIMNSGAEYEFRTTVVDQLHGEESFRGIGPWIEGAERYFLQAFKDRDTVAYSGFSAPSKEKMLEYARIMQPFVGKCELRGID